MKKASLTLILMLGFSCPVFAGITSIVTQPDGANGEVQFNQSGRFKGSANLTYSTSTRKLDVPEVEVTTITFGDGSKQTTASVGSGSITVGDPVSGASTNEVLYVDGSGNLAVSSLFGFDGSTLSASFGSFVGSVTTNQLSGYSKQPLDLIGSSTGPIRMIADSVYVATFTSTGAALLTVAVSSNATVGGKLTVSGGIAGSGTAVTGLVPSNVVSGTLGSGVLISTVPASLVGVGQFNFTGTPSATTYARGDGTWATVSSSGGDAVLAATQTWSGGNTYNSYSTFVGSVTINNASNTLGGNGAAITNISGSNVSGGTFGAVNGSALTSLTAANISAGTLGSGVLISTVPALNGSQLTNLTAANISAGTLGTGVLVSTMPNNVPFGGGLARSMLFVNTSTQIAQTAAATNGQILIGSTGANPALAAITQNSANQVIVTNGAGTITLSTPQSINTNSSVQFGLMGLNTAPTSTPQILTVSGGGSANTALAYATNIGMTPTTLGTFAQYGLRGHVTDGASSAGSWGTTIGVYGQSNNVQVNGFAKTWPLSIGVLGEVRAQNPSSGVSTTTLAIGVAAAAISTGTSTTMQRITTYYGFYASSSTFNGFTSSSTGVGTNYQFYADTPQGTGYAFYSKSGNTVFNDDDLATSSVTIKGGGLVVGTGNTAVSKIMRGSASLNFGATAGGTCDDLTMTVTGAVDGDEVFKGVPNALASSDASAIFTAWVSAADTVNIRRCCDKLAGNCTDPAAATVKSTVFH